MYLADRELRARLNEMEFEVSEGAPAFDAASQVQPCSIDIRLDATFWKPTATRFRPFGEQLFSSRVIDLRKSRLIDTNPNDHWQKISLREGESIDVPPGGIVMGRTFEKFSIPANCAGKIEGRSSFARLGLAVHCTGDFINPGWRGRMPLQLINRSRTVIRLTPFLPICQVMLVQLSSTPSNVYGDEVLGSNYQNDDGGPSYWWRDKKIQQLQTKISGVNLQDLVRTDLIRLLTRQEPEIIARFEKDLERLRLRELTSSHDILLTFSRREAWRGRAQALQRALGISTFLVLLGICGSSWFSPPYGTEDYVLWIATFFSAPISWLSLQLPKHPPYFQFVESELAVASNSDDAHK